MTKDNGSPRWLVLLLVLGGVLVDLATLSWLWQTANLTQGLTQTQLMLTIAGASVAGVMISLGIFAGTVRTSDW